jgi:GAF domain-containing protein
VESGSPAERGFTRCRAGGTLPVDARARAAAAAAPGVPFARVGGGPVRDDGVAAAPARSPLGSEATLSVVQPPVVAEEYAALRRVATLVAGDPAPEEVFAAVTEEVGQLLPVDFAIMGRYDADGMITCIATWGTPAARFPLGSRSKLDGKNLVTIVLETGRPARVDDFAHASGQVGTAGRASGFHSAVGTPIVVERHLWGVMTVGSTLAAPPVPADTEARLASFTELVATAIANAESRAGLARLAEEQAALRRVATLVARGAPPKEVFDAVTEEVGRLLPVDFALMGRYEPERMVASIAAWGEPERMVASIAAWGDPVAEFPVGSRWGLEGRNLVTTVFETGRPARLDRYLESSTGDIGDVGRATGFQSTVGAPILVEGCLWGVIAVGSTQGEPPLPADSEARLGSFTELVATAIANAESRAGLARLAEEQAALRRVATLVAGGAQPEEVFAVVIEEVGRLFPVDLANMCRYKYDGTETFVASWGSGDARFRPGSRHELGGNNLGTLVLETGRPVRIDSYASASGPLGDTARETGLRSAIATPIVVDGRLWGMIGVGTSLEQPLPADTETRLASFTELVATAIANAESRAALAASRARIVAAADESRRRIERDLHDGAQQRLVHAVIVLKLALRALSNGEANAHELVAEALRHAEQANSELRELAHGILPAALTRGGLRAGIEALVSRVPLPVSVDVPVARLPPGVEATAYFVVSEAITNVIKHARAEGAEVTARVEGGELRVEVRDDGAGGARSGEGTGLGGLEDRVSALDGRLVVESPPGGGTRVCARIPVRGPG